MQEPLYQGPQDQENTTLGSEGFVDIPDNNEKSDNHLVTVGRFTIASPDHPNSNEDASSVNAEKKSLVICDGAGGHGHGEWASHAINNEFKKVIANLSDNPTNEQVKQAYKKAWNDYNDEVIPRLRRNLENHNEQVTENDLKTTVSAVTVTETHYVWAHAGDTRLMVVNRSGEIRFLTQDDGMLAELVRQGHIPQEHHDAIARDLNNVDSHKKLKDYSNKWQEIANKEGFTFDFKYLFGKRNVIRAAASNGPDDHINEAERRIDDVFVIGISDGVYDNLSATRIKEIIQQSMTERWSAQDLTEELVEAAEKLSRKDRADYLRAKPDDISAVAMNISEFPVNGVTMIDASTFELVSNQGAVILGRSEGATFRLEDNPKKLTISRRHAQVMQVNGTFWIQDLNSSNGTMLNGRKILAGEWVQLPTDSEIRFGEENTVQVQIDGNAIRFVQPEFLGEFTNEAVAKEAEPSSEYVDIRQGIYQLISPNIYHDRQAIEQLLKDFGWWDSNRWTITLVDDTEKMPMIAQIKSLNKVLEFIKRLEEFCDRWLYDPDDVYRDIDRQTLALEVELLLQGLFDKSGRAQIDHFQKVFYDVFAEKLREQNRGPKVN